MHETTLVQFRIVFGLHGAQAAQTRMDELVMMFQIYRAFHVLVTGIPVILMSTFLAAGAIGENFTDNPFPYPLWLSPIAVWGIGAVLSFVKKTVKIGLVISALPLLFFIISYIRASNY